MRAGGWLFWAGWLAGLGLAALLGLSASAGSGCHIARRRHDGGLDVLLEGTCRFTQPSCSMCIVGDCAAEALACYGEGWTAQELCDENGASAACTTTGTPELGLERQTAYATCVSSHCVNPCN